jgi:predicted acetyltransferase
MNADAKEGLLLYTAAYSFATIGIFAVLIKMTDYTFEGFNGLAKYQPVLAATTTIFLLSLAGIPLTGGFISKFQLLEIKYFDSSLLLSNKIDFAIDTNVIRKININECDIIELYKHPYIGKELAKRLWEFRKAHYPLTSNKIQMMRSMPIETCVKLNPYLDFRPNTK